jgi:predicted transcriptional regulator
MPTLAIDDELFERVATIARARNVSVHQQAHEFLSEAVDRRSRAKELRRLFDEIAALTPEGVQQTDSVRLLREDRNR